LRDFNSIWKYNITDEQAVLMERIESPAWGTYPMFVRPDADSLPRRLFIGIIPGGGVEGFLAYRP